MVHIRPLEPHDWPRVSQIYAAGIATGNATFETAVPSWEEWDAAHLASCRIVVESGGLVGGWGALSTVSGRCVYAGVAETSVYVDPANAGSGMGTALLRALVTKSEADGIWTLKAGIFPENEASIRIHEKCGFRTLGTQKGLGRMQDRGWRDMLLMERRSETVGVE